MSELAIDRFVKEPGTIQAGAALIPQLAEYAAPADTNPTMSRA
jgi:hypothetical protein